MAVIVRLWERSTDEGVIVNVLERTDAALARPRQLGGAVYDVAVERAPYRKEAQLVLATSRRAVEPEHDDAGRIARARKAVVAVDLTPPAKPADQEG